MQRKNARRWMDFFLGIIVFVVLFAATSTLAQRHQAALSQNDWLFSKYQNMFVVNNRLRKEVKDQETAVQEAETEPETVAVLYGYYEPVEQEIDGEVITCHTVVAQGGSPGLLTQVGVGDTDDSDEGQALLRIAVAPEQTVPGQWPLLTPATADEPVVILVRPLEKDSDTSPCAATVEIIEVVSM